MSPCSGVGDRRWSLAMDPNLAMERPGLTRRRLGRAARRGLRESARDRSRQRRTAPGGYHQVDAGQADQGSGTEGGRAPRPI